MLSSMIRVDMSPAPSSPSPRVPVWALPEGPVSSDANAAFCAGAALTSLDNLVRSGPAWAGAWRQRLALKGAASACRLAGRSESEAALRDAWHLRQAGDDPGPAGTIYGAWRQLANRKPDIDVDGLASVVEWLGLRWEEAFAGIPGEIDALIRSGRAAPFAAAAIADRVVAICRDAELLAWWLADLVLAQKLRWPQPVPLLMAQVFTPAFRATGHGRERIRPGGEEIERAVCLALAQGAAEACRLAAEISRRAERLAAITPKLRAKGAGDVVKKLLGDDAVSASLTTPNLSRFGARRLFARLQSFDAVRELSGRPTFRLYGL